MFKLSNEAVQTVLPERLTGYIQSGASTAYGLGAVKTVCDKIEITTEPYVQSAREYSTVVPAKWTSAKRLATEYVPKIKGEEKSKPVMAAQQVPYDIILFILILMRRMKTHTVNAAVSAPKKAREFAEDKYNTITTSEQVQYVTELLNKYYVRYAEPLKNNTMNFYNTHVACQIAALKDSEKYAQVVEYITPIYVAFWGFVARAKKTWPVEQVLSFLVAVKVWLAKQGVPMQWFCTEDASVA